MFTNILFDLDGTLLDTSPGVFRSFKKVGKFFNLQIDEKAIPKMIGPPLFESLTKILGLCEKDVAQATKIFREHYNAGAMFDCIPYPGILELLLKLRENKKRLFIATNKNEECAKKIIYQKKFEKFFCFVGGSDETKSMRMKKSCVVKYVIKTQGIPVQSCILLGDTIFDVQGAHKAGIKCAAVLWGFGNEAELKNAGADFILKTPKDAIEFLLNKN